VCAPHEEQELLQLQRDALCAKYASSSSSIPAAAGFFCLAASATRAEGAAVLFVRSTLRRRLASLSNCRRLARLSNCRASSASRSCVAVEAKALTSRREAARVGGEGEGLRAPLRSVFVLLYQ
jgi:hypothetical protein